MPDILLIDAGGAGVKLWDLIAGGGEKVTFGAVAYDTTSDKVYVWTPSDGEYREIELVDREKVTFITTGTISIDTDVIYGDTSGGAFTLTLPPIADVDKKIIHIKKLVGFASILTIVGDDAETIDLDDVKLTGNRGPSISIFPRTATDWSII